MLFSGIVLVTITIDHISATQDLKEIKRGDFMKAWRGIASLQFALPAFWTEAKKSNCSVVGMAQWLFAKPATLIGLHKSKGKIAVDYDADIVVWGRRK